MPSRYLHNLLRGILLAVFAIPGAQASPSWSAYNLLAKNPETWVYHDDSRFAGVSGPHDSRTFLIASAQCSVGDADKIRISFGSLVSSVYRLYFVRELIPAIADGSAVLSVRVDDGKLYPLESGTATIDRLNQVVINGTLDSERGMESQAINELMSGSKTNFQIRYNGSLMLTQTFTLSESSDAIGSIRCPDRARAVAEASASPLAKAERL
jgi:hypothetical protein